MTDDSAPTLRARLARAIDPIGWEWYDRADVGRLENDPHPAKQTFHDHAFAQVDRVLALLADPSDADVERVAREIWEDRYPDEDWDDIKRLATETEDGGNGRYLRIMGHARAAIRALVGETGG